MSEQDPGQLVEKIGHDECGSSDALAVYLQADGNHTGYCWSCGQWVADPYGEKDGQPKGKKQAFGMGSIMTLADKQAKINKIFNEMPIRALPDRGIREDIASYFGVRAGVSPTDAVTITEHYYPMTKDGALVGYKVRKVETKDFPQYLTDKEHELFGQHQAAYTGAKKLFITEGECDAMALYQVLTDLAKGTDYEQYKPAVVSITRGADKSEDGTKVVNELSRQRAFLDKFEEIILVFDQDEAGAASAAAVSQLWPEKVKTAKLPMKDANAMLQAGKLQELKRAVMWNADSYKPSGIRTVSSLKDEARKKAEWGKSWPWPTLTRLSFGIRKGELIGVGAGVGVGKCHGAGTIVHMANGHTLAVEEVRTGDKLMGPDSTHRTVLSTSHGYGELYRIVPTHGSPWVCNDVHVLSLKVSDPRYGKVGQVIDVPLDEFLSFSKRKQKGFKLWRPTGGVEYPKALTSCDPYIVGVYLGDGTKLSSTPTIHLGTEKSAVAEELYSFAANTGLSIKRTETKGCYRYSISQPGTRHNWFKRVTSTLISPLTNERSVPTEYIINSSAVRLSLLAGILDTDGYLHNNTYDLVCKDRLLSEQIAWLAMSVGLRVKASKKIVAGKVYHRLSISGDVDMIPTVRHNPLPRLQKKNPLVTGFAVEHIGLGDYYGFTLDGDHRYLIEDFQVTHNTSFWHALEEHEIMKHGTKIGVFMLEEPNKKTLKMIAGKFKGKQYHNPEVEYDQAELDEALDALDDKIILYDHNEDRTWDTIKAAIRHMVLVEQCEVIILDPITAMTSHLDSSKTNDELNRMFGEVSAMAETLQFTLFYSSHLNAPDTGAPHEEGGRVKLAQFTGSRAMIKWSHYIIGLERNTQAEDLIEKNTVTCRVLKDREHGRTGHFPIVYYPDTGQFIEPASQDKTEGVQY